MMKTKLGTLLNRVSNRTLQYRCAQLATTISLILLLGCVWVETAPAWLMPAVLPASQHFWWVIVLDLVLTAFSTGLVLWLTRDRVRTLGTTARRIEQLYPELDGRLLAAIEESRKIQPGRVVGYLPAAVIREAIEHHDSHAWYRVVPSWRYRGVQLLKTGLFLALVFLALGITWSKSALEPAAAAPVTAEGRATAADILVEPGDTEVESGTPLLVVARFRSHVPGQAQLMVEAADPPPPAPMARSLEDPTFAGRIEAVTRDLSYRVAFDGGTSPTYRVRVFTFPEVRQVDAQLAYPTYTGLESKSMNDVRHVTAVEGTTLTLAFQLNKEVTQARLVDENRQTTPLELVPGSVTQDKNGQTTATYKAGWVLDESHKYKVELVDQDGRSNKVPTDLAVNVTINRPATVVLSQPGKDVRVSPVEELKVQARTEDDFGVVRHGINFTSPGGEPVDIVLDPSSPASKKRLADHLIAFEDLNAQPDQLVSYFFWAEDIGPDAQPRRTASDLFFAEVRHFEEIFRQGEAPPSGSEAQQQQQQQNAQQAEKLAELQKQIIAATWKLVRREDLPDPTPAFATDATAIREAQAKAIEQTGPMAAALRDATSKVNLEAAVKAMKQAEALLTDAVNGLDITKLKPALASEQIAYQALLKLRAREFEVSRQQSRQQQGGGSGSASQQQLNELELSNDENRYEERKSAQSQQEASKAEAERRETRQVLNRLAELARRQTDLNERLKELQAALDAAKTPEAKAEAERQLKRLRDQEQQILRDTDEVRERMEREENRDRMAESRPEIDRSREQIRQASAALENGQVSQALNQGTRAERQLKNLREDLRKQSAERFTDEVTQMRDQARHLADEQTKMSDQLTRWDDQSKRSLRDPQARQDVGANLTQQKKELDQLLNQMRETVTQAEETEPLLAKELFDAVQKTTRKEIPKSLDQTGQLAQAGLPDEAARSSRQAAEGLDHLRDGVERAARSILGDESAALKRAQSELEDLANQASRGLARTDDPNSRRSASPAANDSPRGELARAPSSGAETPREDQPGIGSDPRNTPAGRSDPGSQRTARSPRQPGEASRTGQNQKSTPGSPQAGDQAQPEENQPASPTPSNNQEPQPGQAQGQPSAPRGQQPGNGAGQQPNQAQPGQNASGAGTQPAGSPGQQPGETRSAEQPGNDPGQGAGGPGQGAGSSGRGQQAPGQPGGRGGAGSGNDRNGDLNRLMEEFEPASNDSASGNPNGGGGRGARGETNRQEGPNPITGEGFRQWSDRLRDVEELVNSPDLRAEAARIRDRARGVREEARRHAAPIDPTKLKNLVADPILELRNRVAEEVRRRESPDALVPIDRDPVPPRFAEGVRRYYERLGSGR